MRCLEFEDNFMKSISRHSGQVRVKKDGFNRHDRADQTRESQRSSNFSIQKSLEGKI